MQIHRLEQIISSHPLFAGMDEDYCELVGGCGKNVRLEKGAYLFREGDPASQFYLVRHGQVALELIAPGRAPLCFLTVNEGEVAGVSWLVPPYRWLFDARALELTRAVSIDACCLRDKAEANHDFGYEMLKRFSAMLVQRLHAAQLQILDVYGVDV